MLKGFHIQDWLQRRFHILIARSEPAQGILVLSAGGLGDTVLFAIILPRLLELCQDKETVTILLRSDAAKMAFLFPPGVGLEVVDFKQYRKSLSYRRKINRRLFKANYRLVISSDYLRHPDLDEGLVAATATQAIAMEPRSWPKHDKALQGNRRLYGRLYDSGSEHVDKVVRWSRFVDWIIGKPNPLPALQLETDIQARQTDVPDILIQPFSAVKEKQSSPDLYQDIIQSLPPNTRIAITGTRGDLESNPEFNSLLELPNVSFDTSSFVDLVPTLKATRLVISVDTAMMHLAVVLGTQTLCLASAAYVGEIVPYDDDVCPSNAHFIYHDMDCRGCLGACHLSPIDDKYPCVAGIKHDDVVGTVNKLYGETPQT